MSNMAIQAENEQGLSEFLLNVSKAQNFLELKKALQLLQREFTELTQLAKRRNEQKNIATFLQRYYELTNKAKEILNEHSSYQKPTIAERAVFGEMVALLDFSKKRINQ
jgi:hypothetical protein